MCRLRVVIKFRSSAHCFSKVLSVPFSFSFSSGSPIMQMLCLIVFLRSLRHCSFVFILLFFLSSDQKNFINLSPSWLSLSAYSLNVLFFSCTFQLQNFYAVLLFKYFVVLYWSSVFGETKFSYFLLVL